MSSQLYSTGSSPVLHAARDSPARSSWNPPRTPEWRRAAVTASVAVDVGVCVVVSASAISVGARDPSRAWDPALATYLSIAGAAVALVVMGAARCWEPQVIGQGTEEFTRVLRAFAFATLLLALAGLFFKSEAIRPWVFGVLPVTGLGVLVGRGAIRWWVLLARRTGRCMASVLVVGTPAAIADLAARTRRVPHHGWNVVAACTAFYTPSAGADPVAGVPVVGDLDGVARKVAELAVDVVAITPTPGWSSGRLRRLAWELEGSGVELVVDPGLMEIGGPRLHVAPVDGLPVLRLTEPRLGGAARVAKCVSDRIVAVGLLLLLAPVLVTLAVVVKRDGGPVFYRQERIGRHGRSFRMIKFRSMVVDAERDVAPLDAANDGAGPLFKLKRDPRVTSVGRTLRRFSLDELPQLFNVVAGSMSLVGPRPPLPREVDTYADDARRRLLVRPGITGLWQVSGRSDLSWEESVRLDLRYVENWSPALDFSILCKTVGAVLRGRGAY